LVQTSDAQWVKEVGGFIAEIVLKDRSSRPLGDEYLSACSAEEKATLRLLELWPQARQCETQPDVHIADRRLRFRRGLAAAGECLELASNMGDLLLVEAARQLMAHAHWQLGETNQALVHIGAAADALRALNGVEPGWHQAGLIRVLRNAAVVHEAARQIERAAGYAGDAAALALEWEKSSGYPPVDTATLLALPAGCVFKSTISTARRQHSARHSCVTND
jgi:hypothetical protein